MKEVIDRTGEKDFNNSGRKMWILKYNSANKIVVQFDSGAIVRTKYNNFKTGSIRDPYERTVYGVGYVGQGEYTTVKNGKHSKTYKVWTSMLQRCYSEKTLELNNTYLGCSVSDDWCNFQIFAKWFDENYYEIKGERVELDKDILFSGNKIYSSNTCLFVPQRINKLFRQNSNIRYKKYIEIIDGYKDKIPNKVYNELISLLENKEMKN